MKLVSVIKNRIINPFGVMKWDFKNREYKLGLLRFFNSLYKGLPKSLYFVEKQHLLITNKLKSEFSEVLEKYRDYECDTHYDPNAPVWVSWLQGYEDAPAVVKKCVDSIRKSTSHPVIFLTNDNISEYVDIPEYIFTKHKKGIITNAQFSDILRMSLLSQKGGLWIDATIFIPKEIPESVFKEPFYTCKRNLRANYLYVSKYRWTSFLNGCQKGCIIQKAMCDLFLAYWKEKNYLIDYLLVDYFMLVVYESFPQAKKLIDELPYNNSQIDDLQNIMNDCYDAEVYHKLINSEDTYLFKLSWRMGFKEKTEEGKLTHYGSFIK